MSVLDEVLCTGHGVGDVVPVLHYLEEKRTYTFAKPAECGSHNTNNVYALYILPSQIGHNFAWVIVRRLMIIMPLSATQNRQPYLRACS